MIDSFSASLSKTLDSHRHSYHQREHLRSQTVTESYDSSDTESRPKSQQRERRDRNLRSRARSKAVAVRSRTCQHSVKRQSCHTVDDINPAFTLGTLNYGNSGIFLFMGHAGFVSSTLAQ